MFDKTQFKLEAEYREYTIFGPRELLLRYIFGIIKYQKFPGRKKVHNRYSALESLPWRGSIIDCSHETANYAYGDHRLLLCLGTRCERRVKWACFGDMAVSTVDVSSSQGCGL